MTAVCCTSNCWFLLPWLPQRPHLYHRVDTVIESSLQEIIGRKFFAPINLNWNFTEVIIKANEIIPENLVAVRWLREIYLYKAMEQPITALQTPDCDWLLHRFIEVNFSKLTDSNQIFKDYFICLHYHLCKIVGPVAVWYECEPRGRMVWVWSPWPCGMSVRILSANLQLVKFTLWKVLDALQTQQVTTCSISLLDYLLRLGLWGSCPQTDKSLNREVLHVDSKTVLYLLKILFICCLIMLTYYQCACIYWSSVSKMTPVTVT